MNTTLNEIYAHAPCSGGWDTLLASLEKSAADDEPLSFKQILDSNGIEDAVWSLRVLDYDDRCLFAADVAESVVHIYEAKHKSKAPRNAIKAVRDYRNGSIGKKGLAAAYAAAVAAYAAAVAAVAAYAAYGAAADAAYAAAVAADAANAGAYAAANAANAANAADGAAAANAANAADGAAAARKSKWKEIEVLFIKHFCEDDK